MNFIFVLTRHDELAEISRLQQELCKKSNSRKSYSVKCPQADLNCTHETPVPQLVIRDRQKMSSFLIVEILTFKLSFFDVF